MDFLPCLCAAPIFALVAGVSVALPLRVFVCLEGCVSVMRRASPFGDGRFRDGNNDKIPKVPMRQGSGFIQGGFQNNHKRKDRVLSQLAPPWFNAH